MSHEERIQAFKEAERALRLAEDAARETILDSGDKNLFPSGAAFANVQGWLTALIDTEEAIERD